MEGKLVPGYKRLLTRCRKLHQEDYLGAVKSLLEFYWDLGNEIASALIDGGSRYGGATISRLAKDLKISKTDIYNAMNLCRKFKRSELSPRLTWSHYRALLPLESNSAKTLAKRAEKKGWSVQKLRAEVTKARTRQGSENHSRNGKAIRILLDVLGKIPRKDEIEGIPTEFLTENVCLKVFDALQEAEDRIAAFRSHIESSQRGGALIVGARGRFSARAENS